MNKRLLYRGITVSIALLCSACSQDATAIPLAPTVFLGIPAVPTFTETPSASPTPNVIEPEIVRTIYSDLNHLQQPIDAALDSANNLFVLEGASNRVQVFDARSQSIALWGSAGTGDGQFNLLDSRTGNAVGGIAIDQNDNVYVADAFNSRVQKFDHTGVFVSEWGTKGEGDGQFLRPAGIDIDAEGNVYVFDVYTDVIQKFDSDGKFLARFGDGSGGNKHNDPGYIVIGPDGLIYECDAQFSRVEVYKPDGTQLSTWPLPWGPTGIAIDSKGNVLITLPRSNEAFVNNHVWAFDPQGNLLYQFAGTNNTMGIVVDGSGLAYLVDEGKSMVQVVKLP